MRSKTANDQSRNMPFKLSIYLWDNAFQVELTRHDTQQVKFTIQKIYTLDDKS